MVTVRTDLFTVNRETAFETCDVNLEQLNANAILYDSNKLTHSANIPRLA